jgi:hypothetical protein
MKRVARITVGLAGVPALVVATLLAGVPPAAATPAVSSAYGSAAPAGTITGGPHGLAAGPAPQTTVVGNVTISGLLSTGRTIDTAGAAWSSAKVASPRASTSWTVGLTTYTVSLSANQVAASCNAGIPLAALSASITGGALTETARAGAHATSQVFPLPQVPVVNQAYSFHGAMITLNGEGRLPGAVYAKGISVVTPAQTLDIAVATCRGGHCPPGVRRGAGSAGAQPAGAPPAARPPPVCAAGLLWRQAHAGTRPHSGAARGSPSRPPRTRSDR